MSDGDSELAIYLFETNEAVQINPHNVKMIKQADFGTVIEFIDKTSINTRVSYSTLKRYLAPIFAMTKVPEDGQ